MTVSVELENWARLAGFSLTRGMDDRQPDVFWNQLGEVRYFLTRQPTGWVEISSSDRLGPASFLFSGASWTVVERFLFCWFGETLRNLRKMPFLATLTTVDNLSSGGYRITKKKLDEVERYVLVDGAGRVIAVSSGGRIVAPDRLALLASVMDATIEQIEASFRSADGRPLFTVQARA